MTKPIIIIGTGLAGYNLAKEFRKINATAPLVLITQDDGHFYSKPQLSTALSQAKTPQSLVITPVETMKAQLAATIFSFTQITHLDTHSQVLTLQTPGGEEQLEYSQLVLALGANPKPIALLENIKNHYRVNNLLDYQAFIAAIENKQDLAIIGSGLVGCEFAHDLTKKSFNISVITPQLPLAGLVPSAISQSLQQVLSDLGINWHTPTTPIAVTETDKISLQLANDQTLEVDAVLSAIGLQPNIALAQSAKLKTNQGIVVDLKLQSSVANIYALGDCAEIAGVCRQYVAPILQSARALAQTLNGTPTPVHFPIMPISLKVAAYPVIVLPPIQPQGQWDIEHHLDGIKALFHDLEGNLKGYALSGSQIVHRQDCLKNMTCTETTPVIS